jgi:hypothetical protein
VTKELSEQFPELSFKHSYTEEGMLGTGFQIWRAGTLIKDYKDETSAEVVIDNPVLLEILLKYKAMGMFDPDDSDFSIGNYDNFDNNLLTLFDEITNTPALAVGLLKDGDNWVYVPSSLSSVVRSILDGLDTSLYESDQGLVKQFKAEIEDKNDEILAGFRRVIWKFSEGKVAEEFIFENGQESYNAADNEDDDEDEDEEDYEDEDDED